MRAPAERSTGLDRVESWCQARLPAGLAEFVILGVKLAWACLFGATMLILLIGTKAVWQPDWALARYDFLLIAALIIQALLLTFKLESWREAGVILLFHVTGTIMEIFKVHVGSWSYPEPGLVRIEGVPLFSGFMYASVGSFLARAMRLLDMRFLRYPPEVLTWALGLGIYINFFSHHFLPDARYVLMAATVLLFGRTTIAFTISNRRRHFPMLAAMAMATVLMFIAENTGTRTGTWIYGGHKGFHWAGLAKAGSWYLLLFVSFVQVMLVHRHRCGPAPTGEKDEDQISTHNGPREGH
jgi:uncharacterized membrane protein YoaT (DUF817 family)